MREAGKYRMPAFNHILDLVYTNPGKELLDKLRRQIYFKLKVWLRVQWRILLAVRGETMECRLDVKESLSEDGLSRWQKLNYSSVHIIIGLIAADNQGKMRRVKGQLREVTNTFLCK